MAARPLRDDSQPFPLQLEVELLDRLSEPVRDGKAKSVSALIRAALENYRLNNLVVLHPAQLTISVRLPSALRRQLRQVARAKGTSVGQLVRAAVEAYLPQVEAQTPGQMEMPIAAAPARPSRPSRRRRKRPVRTKRRPARTRGMTRKRTKG